MKNYLTRKPLIIGLFLLLTIFRETGYVTLSKYSSSITSNKSGNSSSNSNSITLKTGEAASLYKQDDSFWRGRLEDIPVLVRLGDIEYGDSLQYNTIEVTINDGRVPFSLWTPLYKNGHFRFNVHYSDNIRLLTMGDNGEKQVNYSFSGHCTISGNISVTGICSRRTAKRLLIDHVLKQVYGQVKEQLKGK